MGWSDVYIQNWPYKLFFPLQVGAASALTPLASSPGHSRVPVPSNQAKYFELLAQYYIMKRQHVLAAHVLLRLAERRSTNDDVSPTLEQRSC